MQSCRPFRQFPFSRLFRHVACMAVILLCIGAGAWGDINWVKSGKDSHLSSDSDNDAYIVNIVGDYTVTDYWKIGKVIINLNDNVVTIKTLMYGVQNKLNLNCSFFVKGSGTLIIENLIANVSADSSSEAGSISINDYLERDYFSFEADRISGQNIIIGTVSNTIKNLPINTELKKYYSDVTSLQWYGKEDTNWNNKNNWNIQTLSDYTKLSNVSVEIPSGREHYPILNTDETVYIKDLYICSETSFNAGAGSLVFSPNGTITNYLNESTSLEIGTLMALGNLNISGNGNLCVREKLVSQNSGTITVDENQSLSFLQKNSSIRLELKEGKLDAKKQIVVGSNNVDTTIVLVSGEVECATFDYPNTGTHVCTINEGAELSMSTLYGDGVSGGMTFNGAGILKIPGSGANISWVGNGNKIKTINYDTSAGLSIKTSNSPTYYNVSDNGKNSFPSQNIKITMRAGRDNNQTPWSNIAFPYKVELSNGNFQIGNVSLETGLFNFVTNKDNVENVYELRTDDTVDDDYNGGFTVTFYVPDGSGLILDVLSWYHNVPTWTGETSSSWANTANWTGLPTGWTNENLKTMQGYEVKINYGCNNYPVISDSDDISVKSINVQGGAKFTISNGELKTSAISIVGDYSFEDANFTYSGGSISGLDGGKADFFARGNSEIQITASGTFEVNKFLLGEESGTDTRPTMYLNSAGFKVNGQYTNDGGTIHTKRPLGVELSVVPADGGSGVVTDGGTWVFDAPDSADVCVGAVTNLTYKNVIVYAGQGDTYKTYVMGNIAADSLKIYAENGSSAKLTAYNASSFEEVTIDAPVELHADMEFSTSSNSVDYDVCFKKSLSADGYDLDFSGQGFVLFSGAVTAETLTTEASCSAGLGGSVTTTGAQTYKEGTTVFADSVLIAGTAGSPSLVTFEKKLDTADEASSAPTVTIGSEAIATNVVFNGAVGSESPLKGMTIYGKTTLGSSCSAIKTNGEGVAVFKGGFENTPSLLLTGNAEIYGGNTFTSFMVDNSDIASPTTVKFEPNKAQIFNTLITSGTVLFNGNSAQNVLTLTSTDGAEKWQAVFKNKPTNENFSYTRVSYATSLNDTYSVNALRIVPNASRVKEGVAKSTENWFANVSFKWTGSGANDLWTTTDNWLYYDTDDGSTSPAETVPEYTAGSGEDYSVLFDADFDFAAAFAGVSPAVSEVVLGGVTISEKDSAADGIRFALADGKLTATDFTAGKNAVLALYPRGDSQTAADVLSVSGTKTIDSSVAVEYYDGNKAVSGKAVYPAVQNGIQSFSTLRVSLQNASSLLSFADAVSATDSVTLDGSGISFSDQLTLGAPGGSAATLSASGNVSFGSLVCEAPGSTLTFAAGTVQTVSTALTLVGTELSPIILKSNTDGTPWRLDCSGASALLVHDASIFDSYNISLDAQGTAVRINTFKSVDGGGNAGWNFPGTTYTWQGGASGSETDWQTAANWLPASVPGQYATVVIPATSATTNPVLTAGVDLARASVTDEVDGAEYGSSLAVQGDATFSAAAFPLTVGAFDLASGASATFRGGTLAADRVSIAQGASADFGSSSVVATALINDGDVRLIGAGGQTVASTVMTITNGDGSSVEYYSDGAALTETLAWGNKYSTLRFNGTANFTAAESAEATLAEIKAQTTLGGSGEGALTLNSPLTVDMSASSHFATQIPLTVSGATELKAGTVLFGAPFVGAEVTVDEALVSAGAAFTSSDFTMKGGSFTANDTLSCQNLACFGGTLSANADITASKDMLVLGEDYSADDPVTGISGLLAYTTSRGATLNYGKAFPAGPYDARIAVSSGKKLSVGKNFYVNGAELAGQSAAEWLLCLAPNRTAQNGFAEAYNSKVSYSKVICSDGTEDGSHAQVASENCTEMIDGSCVNWDFDAPTIAESYTVYDDVVYVRFDRAMRNSGGEFAAALTGGAVSYGTEGTLAHYSGFYADAECTTALAVAEDGITEAFIKSDATWNTDATGTNSGADESTDRGGTHRTAIPFVDVPASYASGGDGAVLTLHVLTDCYGRRLTNYGSLQGGASFTAVSDRAAPVLVGARTGQELHSAPTGTAASQKMYDSHNFVEFAYSEPVNFGGAEAGTLLLSDTTEAKNVNVRATLALGAHSASEGSSTATAGSGIQFAGLASFTSGALTTGTENAVDATVHALYRIFARTAEDAQSGATSFQTHRIREAVAGFVDGERTAGSGSYYHWLGYIDSATLPAGAVTPLANAQLTDASGNAIDASGTEQHPLTALTTDSTDSELYGAWDVSAPVFAEYNSLENTGAGFRGSAEIAGGTNGTSSILTRLEFHVWDNGADVSAADGTEWFTQVGWRAEGSASLKTDYSYAPDVIGGARPYAAAQRRTRGGIRYSSLYDKTAYFSYSPSRSADHAEYNFDSSQSMGSGKVVRNTMFFTGETGYTERENYRAVTASDDNLYFAAYFERSAKWSLNNTFFVQFDERACVTDLAGNRMKSAQIHSIDSSNPRFTLSLARADGDQLYFVVNKKLSLGKVKLIPNDSDKAVEYSALEKIPQSLRIIKIDSSGSYVVSDDLQVAQNVPAKKAFQTENFTGLTVTLSRPVTLEDIRTCFLQAYAAETSKEPVSGAAGAYVTFLQDEQTNYVLHGEAHPLSDFAIDVVNPVYAYDSGMTDEAQGGAYLEGSLSVHDWSASQRNFGTLRAGNDIFIKAVLSGCDAESDSLPGSVSVYLDSAPDEQSISGKFNADMVSEDAKIDKLRLWLPGRTTALEEVEVIPSLSNVNNASGSLLSYAAQPDEDDALSYLFEIPAADMYGAEAADSLVQAASGTSEASANATASEGGAGWKAGDQISFLFGLNDSAGSSLKICHSPEYIESSDSYFVPMQPLFALRLKSAADLSSVDLWSFRLKSVTLQRGGVTILNNVINASNGEQTTLKLDMGAEGSVSVMVMTLDGNIVKYLHHGTASKGEHYFNWDGTTKSGRTVARGLYFIRVIGSGFDETRKVLVVKD